MNSKRIWLILPTSIVPYLALGALAMLFFSTSNQVLETIMESLFHGNFLYLVVVFLAFCVIALALNVVYLVSAIRGKWDALSLAKYAMLVKLIQVPAYILIFVLGTALLLTVFTFPVTIALILVDGFTLFLTGLMSVAAAINSVKQGISKRNEIFWVVLLQLFFCTDVIAACVFYLRLRKNAAQ